ncbi:hypothetical protein C8J57DRAFT_1229602 [Mycena rebaudengoi]|nr:hypothetical protein C8J57DRAFT_1229602 [Mycena rebaudengoi]
MTSGDVPPLYNGYTQGVNYGGPGLFGLGAYAGMTIGNFGNFELQDYSWLDQFSSLPLGGASQMLESSNFEEEFDCTSMQVHAFSTAWKWTPKLTQVISARASRNQAAAFSGQGSGWDADVAGGCKRTSVIRPDSWDNWLDVDNWLGGDDRLGGDDKGGKRIDNGGVDLGNRIDDGRVDLGDRGDRYGGGVSGGSDDRTFAFLFHMGFGSTGIISPNAADSFLRSSLVSSSRRFILISRCCVYVREGGGDGEREDGSGDVGAAPASGAEREGPSDAAGALPACLRFPLLALGGFFAAAMYLTVIFDFLHGGASSSESESESELDSESDESEISVLSLSLSLTASAPTPLSKLYLAWASTSGNAAAAHSSLAKSILSAAKVRIIILNHELHNILTESACPTVGNVVLQPFHFARMRH